jgi:hypothetical protein
MSAGITTARTGITDRLKAIMTRVNDIRPVLNNRVYKIYQDAQIARWNTEGWSEGRLWPRLNPEYAKRKAKKYAEFPYQGTKMMVATGTLLQAVVGTNQTYHRKIVDQQGIRIFLSQADGFLYAGFANDRRNFTTFGPDTRAAVSAAINNYIKTGAS